MTLFPEVLEQALAADAAYEACNRTLHPRIKDRLWRACQSACNRLAAEYPELEEWLFGQPYRNQAERHAELRRLLGVGHD